MLMISLVNPPSYPVYSVQSNLVISNIIVYVNLVHIVVVTLLAGHPRLVSFTPSLWQRLVFHSYDTPNHVYQGNGEAKILQQGSQRTMFNSLFIPKKEKELFDLNYSVPTRTGSLGKEFTNT